VLRFLILGLVSGSKVNVIEYFRGLKVKMSQYFSVFNVFILKGKNRENIRNTYAKPIFDEMELIFLAYLENEKL